MIKWITKPSLIALFAVLLVFSACYSFTGISIGTEVDTYTVNYFENAANNVVPNLSDRMAEDLRSKVANNTRLKHISSDGDVQFSGTITQYDIQTVAPKENETVTFGRLQITVNVEYIDNTNEKNNWTSRFIEHADFPSDADFSQVEEGLIDDINDLLIQDIFDKAFTNW